MSNDKGRPPDPKLAKAAIDIATGFRTPKEAAKAHGVSLRNLAGARREAVLKRLEDMDGPYADRLEEARQYLSNLLMSGAIVATEQVVNDLTAGEFRSARDRLAAMKALNEQAEKIALQRSGQDERRNSFTDKLGAMMEKIMEGGSISLSVEPGRVIEAEASSLDENE